MVDYERGASAVLIALSMVLLMGIAAVAIDVGAGFNQRRQDQTAADVGVMAGAIEAPASSIVVRDQIMDFAERNVIVERTQAQWQTEWSTCVDPELATLNASGFHFVPVPAPAGWGVATINCISTDQAGFVRVQLPNLEFATTFGRVIGVDELSTQADAIATITSSGGGGVLPFGLLATAGEGQHVCLRDSSGGHAQEPCDGPDAGNFGAMESPLYGNPVLNTTQNCNGSPKKDVLAINIALGIDHLVWADSDGSTSNEIRDICAEMNAGKTPDTLNTFTGISNGLIEGLASGPVPGGFTPRLQQGSNPKKPVYGDELDNKPLWEYIDPSLDSTAGTPDDLPAICERDTFDNSLPDFDWDGDGTKDEPESWQHLTSCLATYVANGDTAILFLDDLESAALSDSPRFAYVPQFHESTFGSGNSWRHIARFKATWIQATWWKKGNTVAVFHPGEAGTFNQSGNWHLIQLSGIVIPDAALPPSLRGSPPPGGGVNPFEAQLYR